MQAPIKDRLSFMMEGANTSRFHTRPGIRSNTVGHHSHSVVMLIWLVSNGQASAQLLMAGASHDLGEQITSDVSKPSKILLEIEKQLQDIEDGALRRYGFFFEITDLEKRWLKIADMFDLLLYCCSEAALGNRNVELIWTRVTARYVRSELNLEPHQADIYRAICQIYQENTGNGPSFNCYA